MSGITRRLFKKIPSLIKVYRFLVKHASRQMIVLSVDILVGALAIPCALTLRLLDGFTSFPAPFVFLHVGIFTLISLGWYLITLSYTRLWRTLGLGDMLAYLKLSFYIFLTYLPMFFALNTVCALPRSLPILAFFIQTAGLLSIRYIYFTLHHSVSSKRGLQKPQERYIILGGDAWLEEVLHKQQVPQLKSFDIKGVLHAKKAFVGRSMYGTSVLGTYKDLRKVLNQFKDKGQVVDGVLVTDNGLSSKDFRELLDTAATFKTKILKLYPQPIMHGNITTENMSVEDLLGRDEINLEASAVKKFIRGQSILVTGAGGSIGAELVRQIATFEPDEILLLDSSEYQLYSIDLELSESHPKLKRQALLADITDKNRIWEIFKAHGPTVVFHAAALKHVPMVETNPLEGLATNVLGTRLLADACKAHKVEAMVMISTDKAVNPSNIMGASKRLAETYCQALDVLNKKYEQSTRFVTVRFGNVLGSTGSVVPLFQRQIAKGGPVTVTHPNMIRYFMTIKEAVSLVLQAGVMGAESLSSQGKIFVLDMGQPVRIADLARQMILLSGHTPGEDIKIKYTGVRPGEKLYEELFHEGEVMDETPCSKIFQAAPRFTDYYLLASSMDELAQATLERNFDKAFALLGLMVPEYSPKKENPKPKKVVEPLSAFKSTSKASATHSVKAASTPRP